jgi:hypothetical protein
VIGTFNQSRMPESDDLRQASLRRAVTEYMDHYHAERNRQGLENRLIHERARRSRAADAARTLRWLVHAAAGRGAPLGACAVRKRRAARVPRLVARYRSGEES